APPTTPSGPRSTASTAASEGSTRQTTSAACATAAADGAGLPPRPARASRFSGRRSWPTTAWPAASSRTATAWPRSPRPTTPTVAFRRSRLQARADALAGLGRGDDRQALQVDEVAPPRGPLVEEPPVRALHHLVAGAQVGRHPARHVGQAVGGQ